MAGFDLHFQALDECGKAARELAVKFEEAVKFEGADGKYPAKTADSSMFGKLAGASGMAGVVNRVENTIEGQLGQVASKLRLVERALDQVHANVSGANRAGGAEA